MRETLKTLLAIQEIDQAIHSTDTQRLAHEAALQQIQNDTARRSTILARLAQHATAMAHNRAGLELELKTREGQREKFGKQAMMVRTSKELMPSTMSWQLSRATYRGSRRSCSP